jgi:two-component system response regulator NreC
MVAEGLSSIEISARLSISPRTVEIHRANLMHKLNLHSQSELIRFALKKGILRLDD